MIAFDSETSGMDFGHGAKPFFFTLCKEGQEPLFWEWDVNPLDRQSVVVKEDLAEIRQILNEDQDAPDGTSISEIVGQNIKFDVKALATVDANFAEEWPWERTHDTLTAGHLLASGQPHDLTSMVKRWLGEDIQHFEDHLKECCVEARKLAKKEFPEWMLAAKGLQNMPSVRGSGGNKKGEKDSVWKNDTWLLRTLANELDLNHDHPWWTALSKYACADSFFTLQLFLVQREEMQRLDLWDIYLEKLRMTRAIYGMERRGVRIIRSAMTKVQKEYRLESAKRGAKCVAIAKEFGHELTLPKNGNNGSLLELVFEKMRLPVLKRTETGAPSFDKEVVAEYSRILTGSKLEFVKNLGGKRKRDKLLEFFNSYEAYGIDRGVKDSLFLHCYLNTTGTTTTRLSCGNPNLQQVSKQEVACEACQGDGCKSCNWTGEDLHSARNAMGPAPGREWWTADASNIELRIPAYESGEPDLIALFERPDDPPFYGSQHLLNFSVVYDDIWEEELERVGLDEVGPHCKKKFAASWYQCCKNGDFAIQYQCGQATADRAFKRQGSYAKLKSRFSRLDALNHRCVAFAQKHGYIETLPDKTVNPRRGYPLQCSRGYRGEIVPTVPLNYRTQGTAGWWMVKAINRCEEQLESWRREGFDAWMCLTVHDELVFDLPKGTGKEPWRTNLPKIRKLKLLMERGGDDIGLPTPVHVEWHDRCWAKGRTVIK